METIRKTIQLIGITYAVPTCLIYLAYGGWFGIDMITVLHVILGVGVFIGYSVWNARIVSSAALLGSFLVTIIAYSATGLWSVYSPSSSFDFAFQKPGIFFTIGSILGLLFLCFVLVDKVHSSKRSPDMA